MQTHEIRRRFLDHFVRAGRLDTSADIFYLTVEEAWSEVTGTAI